MSAKRQPSVVSDHALLRWIERIVGSDVVEKARADILAEGRAKIIPRIRSGRMHLHNVGATLVISNGLVVTVIKPERKKPMKAVRHG